MWWVALVGQQSNKYTKMRRLAIWVVAVCGGALCVAGPLAESSVEIEIKPPPQTSRYIVGFLALLGDAHRSASRLAML